MTRYATHKRTTAGKLATLARRQARAAKYAPAIGYADISALRLTPAGHLSAHHRAA